MDKSFIDKITAITEANIGNPGFGVEELAREMGMSSSSLYRRLHALTAKSPIQFIREIRLRKAQELLKQEGVTAAEVSYQIGFNSPAYFNTCFHDFFGYPPGEVRKMKAESPEKEPLADLPFVRRGEESEERKDGEKNKTNRFKLKPFFRIVALGILVLIAAVLVNPKIFRRDALENLKSSGKISVVVMPFQNLTNDTTLNVWQGGIQENLITNLSNNSEGLIVRQIETIHTVLKSSGTINYTSLTPSVISSISKKLDANVFIRGSINQSGSTIRVNAQLMDINTENVLQPFQIDGTTENILPTLDSLSSRIKNYLIITVLGKELPHDMYSVPIPTTNSPEAYRNFILGRKAYLDRDFQRSIGLYLRALAYDSNYYPAIQQISSQYLNLSRYKESKKWCDKLREKEGLMTPYWKTYADYVYSVCYQGPEENIKYLRQLMDIDPLQPVSYYLLGNVYFTLEQYDNSILQLKKALEIFKNLGIKPITVYYYTLLGSGYNKTGQFRKEKKIYKKAEQDFPDNMALIFRQAILALTEGKIKDADKFIDKFISIQKGKLSREDQIDANLAFVYLNAGMVDKAEGFFRQALEHAPENPMWLNCVAASLENRDLGQAMQFVDRALHLSPDNYEFLDTRGWILYSMGKYQEALEVLQKSWDLRLKNAIYKHEAYLHLEEAKKAVAQKK